MWYPLNSGQVAVCDCYYCWEEEHLDVQQVMVLPVPPHPSIMDIQSNSYSSKVAHAQGVD